ncbi:MAG: hypothetical protein PWP52_129 [Bacteroidales bacterium]|nr:hypothetical protein [Bacteroidales bacterium]
MIFFYETLKINFAEQKVLSIFAHAKVHCLLCLGGGIGRRAGLKHQWTLVRVGSSPTPGTFNRTLF